VQGNLLAQCGTALLVAASAGWVRHSEARYRHVVSQIPVVLYSARLLEPYRPGQPPRAEVLFVSPPSAALLGCPPAGSLGDFERCLAPVPPGDCELLLAALAQLGRQEQPVVCEYRLGPAGGEESSVVPAGPARSLPARPRWLRDTLVPRFEGGALRGW